MGPELASGRTGSAGYRGATGGERRLQGRDRRRRRLQGRRGWRRRRLSGRLGEATGRAGCGWDQVSGCRLARIQNGPPENYRNGSHAAGIQDSVAARRRARHSQRRMGPARPTPRRAGGFAPRRAGGHAATPRRPRRDGRPDHAATPPRRDAPAGPRRDATGCPPAGGRLRSRRLRPAPELGRAGRHNGTKPLAEQAPGAKVGFVRDCRPTAPATKKEPGRARRSHTSVAAGQQSSPAGVARPRSGGRLAATRSKAVRPSGSSSPPGGVRYTRSG